MLQFKYGNTLFEGLTNTRAHLIEKKQQLKIGLCSRRLLFQIYYNKWSTPFSQENTMPLQVA